MTRQGAPGLYTQLKQSDEMIGEKLALPFVWRGSNERSEEGMWYSNVYIYIYIYSIYTETKPQNPQSIKKVAIEKSQTETVREHPVFEKVGFYK